MRSTGAPTTGSWIRAVPGNSGHLLMSTDRNNNVIRMVSPAGIITKFAGTGTPGYSGDGGQATAAQFNDPTAIAVNAAGADDSGEIGELHNPETHLIPLALAATGDGSELNIFGTDYPTPDGTCIRDYIHVNDLADAHVRALQHLEKGGESVALNLGTGRGDSVLDVIKAAEAATGRTVKRKLGPRRPGDPPVLVADAARAQKVLGWRATRLLPEIVSSAWKWMKTVQRSS